MQYIEKFIDYLIHEKRFSEHTIIAYQKDIDQFIDNAGITTDAELITLNYNEIRSFVVSLVDEGLENSSINRKLSSLRTLFRFLRQKGYMDYNPTTKVKSLKQKKVLPVFVPESEVWSSATFDEIEDEFDRLQDECIMEMFYQTGIRLSELIGLKEKNYSGAQIKVLGKRNKERIIPVANRLALLLDAWLNYKKNNGFTCEFIFQNNRNKKLSPKLVYNKVNFYLGKATSLSKKSPHVLRHTFATHMLNNGASLESIKNLLGHVDLSATQIYTHNSFAQIKSIYEQAHPRGA